MLACMGIAFRPGGHNDPQLVVEDHDGLRHQHFPDIRIDEGRFDNFKGSPDIVFQQRQNKASGQFATEVGRTGQQVCMQIFVCPQH